MNSSLPDTHRQSLALAASLLRYPEKPLDDVLGLAPETRLSGVHEHLAHFVEHARSISLDTLQAEHVRSFELNPALCPHLAWHVYGDKPELGRAYASLFDLYREAGLEPAGGELPDHLPLMLEFLALAPDWAGDVLLDGFGSVLPVLEKRLGDQNSLYAPVLAAVTEMLGLDVLPTEDARKNVPEGIPDLRAPRPQGKHPQPEQVPYVPALTSCSACGVEREQS